MNKESRTIWIIVVVVVLALILFGGWYYYKNYMGNTGTDQNNTTDPDTPVEQTMAYGQKNLNYEGVMALAWIQKSGEYQALCYQAFNAAQDALDEMLATNEEGTKAIVLDVDETVLDNSPYNVGLIGTENAYSGDTWANWVKDKKAVAIPGAVEFLKYADSKQIKIYYITNRKAKDELLEPTMENLKSAGFPQVVTEQVLLREDESSKEARRQKVDGNIIMLVGDNLEDFDTVFEGKSNDARKQQVSTMSKDFGNKFIVLPNPVYGSWEGSLDDDYFGLEPEGKSKARLKGLMSWPE